MHRPSVLLLAGASGLVGQAVAAQAAGDATWLQVHALLRRPMPLPQGVRALGVGDFSGLPQLPDATHAVCALGTTLATAGSREAFAAVDRDAVIAFARAARAAGVSHFACVSALGADARSPSFYSRIKGQTEQALRSLGFSVLIIAQPSLLAGDRRGLQQAARPAEALALALTRPLAGVIPRRWRPIAPEAVARALLHRLKRAEPGVHVLSNEQLHALGSPAA